MHHRIDHLPVIDLGDGWTRRYVELHQGDTADNAASTKHPVTGPAFVIYDQAPDGGITQRQYDTPLGYRAQLAENGNADVIPRCWCGHPAAYVTPDGTDVTPAGDVRCAQHVTDSAASYTTIGHDQPWTAAATLVQAAADELRHTPDQLRQAERQHVAHRQLADALEGIRAAVAPEDDRQDDPDRLAELLADHLDRWNEDGIDRLAELLTAAIDAERQLARGRVIA